jgi:hypothetical protein
MGTSYSQITEFFKFGGNIQTSVECLKNKEEFKIINSRLLKQIWQLKYDSTYQTYKVEIGELKSKNHIIHGTYETFSERFNKPKESYTKKTFKHGVQVGKSIEYQNNLVQDSVIYNEIGELIYRWTIDLNKNLANDILIYEANFNNSKISQGIVYNSKKLKLHSMKFKVNEATEINEFYPNGKLKYKFFSKYIDNHLRTCFEILFGLSIQHNRNKC